jgi:hypothetical protein
VTTKPDRPVRWPKYTSELLDLPDAIEKFITNDVTREELIRPGSSVFTMGSCFARHLATNLKRQCSNIDVSYLRAEEDINNTYAIRYIVEALLDPTTRHHSVVEAYFGLSYLGELRRQLGAADVLIYTLGVSPGFFDRKTGDYVIPAARELGMRELMLNCDFRSTTVSENVENISIIFDKLFKINPGLRVVLTVSPVPLKVSIEYKSPFVADCFSKSTLRVAAQEVVQKYDGRVLYWPSFEIVRWLAPLFGPVFGVDDGASRHVSLDVIASVTDAFITRLAAPEVRDVKSNDATANSTID